MFISSYIGHLRTYFKTATASCYNWCERSACARTLCVRARADVVATKLGIILLPSFFLPRTFLQDGFTYDFEFLLAFLSNKKNKI